MRKAVSTLVMAVMILSSCLAQPIAETPQKAEDQTISAQEFPVELDFTVETTQGQWTLSEALARRDLVFVVIWSEICRWCKVEFPFVVQAYRDYGDKVEFLALTIGAEDTFETAERIAEEYGLPFAVGKDTEDFISRLESRRKPGFAIICGTGEIFWQDTGSRSSQDFYSNAIMNALDRIQKL